MHAPDPVVLLVREWIGRAENDLLTAAHTLTLAQAAQLTRSAFTRSNASKSTSKRYSFFERRPFPERTISASFGRCCQPNAARPWTAARRIA